MVTKLKKYNGKIFVKNEIFEKYRSKNEIFKKYFGKIGKF